MAEKIITLADLAEFSPELQADIATITRRW